MPSSTLTLLSPLASLVFLLGAGAASAQTTDHSRMHHAGMHHGAHAGHAQTGQRQAEVAERGKEVMPFSLAATTHIFTKTAQGGVQQVVVKRAGDAEQVTLTRQHLQEIRAQFLQGDYSGPSRIHGQDMPGLAELKAAAPGQIAIAYKDIAGGAELAYTTTHPALVAALHRWFDAQLADHGKDAMAGHRGHGGHGGQQKP
jgi:hypothetical protein